MTKVQKVVRTAPCDKGYWRQDERTSHLQALLNEGYTVVMCNSNGDQWLEYIVEKEVGCK